MNGRCIPLDIEAVALFTAPVGDSHRIGLLFPKHRVYIPSLYSSRCSIFSRIIVGRDKMGVQLVSLLI